MQPKNSQKRTKTHECHALRNHEKITPAFSGNHNQKMIKCFSLTLSPLPEAFYMYSNSKQVMSQDVSKLHVCTLHGSTIHRSLACTGKRAKFDARLYVFVPCIAFIMSRSRRKTRTWPSKVARVWSFKIVLNVMGDAVAWQKLW